MPRTVRFHRFGDAEVLQLDALPAAEPGAGEVRLRVAAFGLNRVETLYRAGGFGPVRFPARIGYEAAGVIEAIGPDVVDWAPGDRVATLFGLSMEDYGTHGEAVVYPADMLVRVPDGQSLIEAAASWMQYGTAFALVEVARIKAGNAVVITAASSSVGLAAIQIVRAEGALPIAVTRGRAKVEALKAHGAAHVIVSDEEDVAGRVLEITQGKGAQVLFDAVAGPALGPLLGGLAPGGIAIVYGLLGGTALDLAAPQLMTGNLTLRGLSADVFVRDRDIRERLVRYVSEGLARGTLKPVIDRCFDLADIAAAHRFLESNAQLGKIVVTTA